MWDLTTMYKLQSLYNKEENYKATIMVSINTIIIIILNLLR